MKTLLLATIILCGISKSHSQWDSLKLDLQKHIDTIHEVQSDGAKEFLTQELKSSLEYLFQQDGFFSEDFSELKYMLIRQSPDKAFNLVSWNYENSNGSMEYFGYIIQKEKKKGKYIFHELVDNKFMYRPRYPDNHTAEEWYGALYYDIIVTKAFNETYYTFLAYNGNGGCSKTKFLESMKISKNKISFGHKIYQIKNKKNKIEIVKRVFMEYKSEAYASLKYHKSNNRIIMDHCIPENSSLEGHYCYYSPSFSLDAYTWCTDKSVWVLHQDVVQTAGNDNGPGINPSDPENPVAVTPYIVQKDSKLDPCIPFGTEVAEQPATIKKRKKNKKPKKPEYLKEGNDSSILGSSKKKKK
jgi:hypothetical protein